MSKFFPQAALSPMACAALACGLLASGAVQAQKYPITAQQRTIANQVAQSGVALSELRADAPASYTIKSGDTLWAISGMYLKSPWRWPELWGMNLAEIKNPHLIYPGQTLYLDTSNGRARLTLRSDDGSGIPTTRLSPRTRIDNLPGSALPTLKNQWIEPFLSEAIVLDEQGLKAAPRIVATLDDRVLLTRGDRAYARSSSSAELMDDPHQKQKTYRVFRNATPLKDPLTGEVLGYEAQFVGKAALARSETTQETANKDGSTQQSIVPATIDIVLAKEEMRVGDRLVPEPMQQMRSYVPHAPSGPVNARIVSIYGSAVVNAAQNQVVVINRGERDGMQVGDVLAIMKAGKTMVDKTDAKLPSITLPDERNGLLMVFSTFEKLSYGLVLDITSGVQVGDHLINPQ